MKILKTSTLFGLSVLLALACSSKLPESEYYTKATDAFNKQEYDKSIENFKKIVEYYPNGERNSEALFMLGYINANHTKDLKTAEKYYKQFIEKYPDDELTDDAQYELKHLGQDIIELPIFQDVPTDSVEEQTDT
ncbi:MAG: outer membrane protein assembly factor BamD, partial [Calditrichaceae bacterium]